MPRPDEGLIHAWLDGELDAAEAARVEKLVAEDAEWGAAAAEARGLIAASTRILGALDVVAGDVIPKGGSAAPAPRAVRRAVPTWMRVAAGFALVLGVSYVARDAKEAGDTLAVATATDTVALAAHDETTARDPQRTSTEARDSQRAPTEDRALRVAPDRRDAREEAAANAVPATPRLTSERAKAAGVSELASPPPAVAARESERRADAESRLRSAASGAGATSGGSVGAVAAPAPSVVAQSTMLTDSMAAKKSADSAQALERQRVMARTLRLEGVVVTGSASATDRAADRAGARPLQQPVAKAAAPNEPPPPLPIIEGCFRVRSRAPIDTLLIDPKILATDADSIRIQMNPNNGFAWVRRDANGALVGRVWYQSTRTANMRADPIDCS